MNVFNAEKLLGGMLRQGFKGTPPAGELFSSGGVFGTKAATGLALLGLAWEAAEHYLGEPRAREASSRPMPPPPPQTSRAVPPPPPAAPAPDSTAVACMRAMIAAAWADGSLDGQERAAIFNGLDALHLTPEETAFLHRELADPRGIEEIAAMAATPEQATAIYTAACVAIVADTAAEHAFLDALAVRLGLDPNAARALKRG
ncbi:DUF533 domain-containing protein [Megalodesulfovibrio gigas]|uniref:DUF533 domain-containing protein n=1 Tax=Megalodesulfovibrio gigas TaxID=879 RepID=UPI000406D71C|nr:DUF533 domain-containing protein [Megalodesulfovibrio gigas]